jgi:hypothetical protein
MASAFIGISDPVFLTVAGALIFAVTAAIFNHQRSVSVWRALIVAGVVAVVGMVALSFIIGEEDDGEAPVADKGGSVSSVAEDLDRDGAPDSEDACPSRPADTEDGCPASEKMTLSAFIEKSEEERFNGEEGHLLYTDNVTHGQITVSGIIEPLGVSMEIGGEYTSGVLTINVQRAYKSIKGRVGITSEPCSGGSEARVAIRNGEGEPLWPRNGSLQPVVRDSAVPFEVDISRASDVIFYAEAPEAEGFCEAYTPGTTVVGWVNVRLVAG